MNYKPSFVLTIYFIIGFLFAIAGPIEYEGIYSNTLLFFFMAFLLFFWIGFARGSGGIIRTNQAFSKPKIYTWVLLISLGYSITMFVMAIAEQGLSAISLQAGAERYARSYEDYERNSGSYSLPWIISELMYPIHLATMVWSIFFFKNLNKFSKWLAVAAIFLIVLNFGIMAGKMKIVGDTMISFLFILLAVYYGQRVSIFRKSALVFGGLLGVMLIVMVISNRYENAEIDIYNINEKANQLLLFDEDSIFVSIFGARIGFAIIQLSSYLSNGYYGLSLALNLPFEWTYFIGNSYSMMVIFNRFLGGEFLIDYTYAARVDQFYDWGLSKWHTAFTWYASDFTFPGTIVFFGFVSYLYGRTWRAVALERNAYAVPIYVYLSIGFFFIPANNQLLISPGGIFTLILFFLIWLWPRKSTRKNYSQRQLKTVAA